MIKSSQLSSADMPLTLADVLNVEEEETKVILIEGAPGMGKSTLAIEICKCWANGELLEEYDAVILLSLRDPEIQAAKSIKDLLLVLDDELRECVYKEITKINGEGICFLLKGFDELPLQLRNSSIFSTLSEKLPKCTLMHTSRPEACNQLRNIASHRIEIRRFKEEQVEEYINNAFENVEDGKEKAVKLIAQVKSNPSIRSIFYVPINVAIICHLFLLTLTLPNTLTELYTLLCLNLILRHINKHSPGKVDYLSSLHNLPVPTNEQFYKLCLIAYRGREEDKIIFSSRELEKYGIDVNKLSGLGLLLIAPSASVYGREKSYNFLHLTVQEYCAAFYMSTLPDEEQVEHFKKYQFNNNFQIIWRMYSGITRLRSKDIFHHMLPSKWVKSDYTQRRIVELLHCVYEAHNDELCSAVVNHLDDNIYLCWCRLDQISCTAVGYLLEQCRGALKLVNLNYCHIGDEGCRIVINSLLSRDNWNCSNFGLELDGNDITHKSSLLIASLLSNCPITKLSVGVNKLFNSFDTIFKSLYENDVLTELELQGGVTGRWSLSSSDMQSLGQMLASNSTLSVVDISYNNIVVDDITDWRNISLDKLIMQNCQLGVSGADKIGKILCHNKSITSVDLSRNSIGDKGVGKLVEHLKSNTTIKHLDLWDNNITSNGANHLMKLFSLNHTTVNSIELGKNPLKDKGVDLILQSITVTMEHVGLYDTGMTSSCFSLSTALHKIKSIRFTLPDNCDGISDSLADTAVLERLVLDNGSDTAYHTMITRNNSIKKLQFSGGQLHHQTLTDLVEVIKVNKIITELVIWFVDVSPSDCLLLADMLTVNTSIKKMTIALDYNQLDQPQVSQFLKQLTHNYTLEELRLRITLEAYNDDQFSRDVEMLVEDINNIRQSHGVTTPLHVRL